VLLGGGLAGALARAPRAARFEMRETGVLGCSGELELASSGYVQDEVRIEHVFTVAHARRSAKTFSVS